MRDGRRWDHCFKSLRLCSDLNGTCSDAHPVALAIEPLFVLFLPTSRFMAVVEFLNLVTGCHRNSGIFWETKVSFGRHCSCGRWNQGNGQISTLIMLSVPLCILFCCCTLKMFTVNGCEARVPPSRCS